MSGKKLLSVLMAVVLAVGLTPAPAFAEGGLAGAHAPLGLAASNIASGTSGTCTWAIDSSGKLTIQPTSGSSGTLGTWDWEEAPWSDYGKKVASVAIVGDVKARTCAGMLQGCTRLRTVDLSGLDTSEVTDMYRMFGECESLKAIDLSGFDTSKVTNMSELFGWCYSLETLDLSRLDTSKVTDMGGMFWCCLSLESLDLSKFDTSKVTSMFGMFHGCSLLKSLDLSNFNTPKLANVYSMFSNCSSLESLDISGLDTSRSEDMDLLFYDCSSLKTIDLSGFDTSNATNMTRMFLECSSLESLGLSGFDTSKVADMGDMFSGCSSLESITVGGKWRAAKSGKDMFAGCEKLVGGNGTKYDAKQVGPSRAVVDKPGQEGYLTGSSSVADEGEEVSFGKMMFGSLQARASKATKGLVTLTWKKVKGAKKYVVYASQCNTKGVKRKVIEQETKKANVTRVTFKKLKNGEGKKAAIKKGTYYKFVVAALGADGKATSVSKTVHVATAGGKVGNVKKVTTAAKKGKVTLKRGKKFNLRAKVVPASKKLKIKRHTAEVAYESSNPKIASVSAKGVVKAKKRGACAVYAYAQNGVCAKVKVTVR